MKLINILKGWITSLLGIGLIALAGYLAYNNGSASLVDMGLFLTGLVLFGVPDPTLNQIKDFFKKP